MKKITLFVILILVILSIFSQAAAASEQTPVRIAIIDTGIRENHAMLENANIEEGMNYAFKGKTTNDLIGHGTRIAGLILGSSDGTLKGTAPDAVLVPLVYYSKYPSGVPQNGGIEAICQAVYDAVDVYNCRIINISSGITKPDERLYKAICYAEEKDVIVVSAVGNENLTHPDRSYYPAAYETVIGVGAANTSLKEAADFSQRSQGVMLIAPGQDLNVLSIRGGGDFELASGTSYAAAQVTGVVARLMVRYPDLKPSDFRQILRNSCQDLEAPGYDSATGWGLLDPEAALKAAETIWKPNKEIRQESN